MLTHTLSTPLTISPTSRSVVTQSPSTAATLVDLLHRRSLHQPQQIAYRFLSNGEDETDTITYRQLVLRSQAVAAKLQETMSPGDRALLLYPAGLDFIIAFFACLYAGIIAVPAYPPRRNQKLARIESIVSDADPAAVLTTTASWRQWQTQCGQLKPILTDKVKYEGVDALFPAVTSQDLAFLQYTSGSTGNPKGVMVSHRNILYNLKQIASGFGHSSKSCGVIWLPQYHDMGLIGGILQPLFAGFPCVLMPPAAFLQSPIRWLSAISNYGATTSGGPNFAYELCVQRISDEQKAALDLSRWQVAFTGAEPVRAETLARFAAAFADCGFRSDAFYPCYGMAETTLIVSGGTPHQPPVRKQVDAVALTQHQVKSVADGSSNATALVSCGRALLSQQIRIVDPATRIPCSGDRVGEIWVAGDHVAQGYWQQSEQTAQTFRAELAQSGGSRYLRTGDLGFIDETGELFVTGRLKDVIIIRGKNYYPQDIEQTVQNSHIGLRPDSGAAFTVSTETGDKLVVVQELERSYMRKADSDGIAKAVRQAIAKQHGLQLGSLVLIKTTTLPKTSSGKVQRRRCQQRYLDKALTVVSQWSIEQSTEQVAVHREPQPAAALSKPIQNINQEILAMRYECILMLVKLQLAETIGLPSIDSIQSDDSFFSIGLDSLKTFEFVTALSRLLACELSAEIMFDSDTPAALSQLVINRLSNKSSSVASSVSKRIDWQAETTLPVDICSDKSLMPPVDKPSCVLITGATGFVGIHLLHHLLHHSDVTVYCLVRAADPKQAAQKITQQLKTFQLPVTREQLRRGIPVCGDLSQPRFGLSAQQFYQLAERVDTIYHLGAAVNHLYGYKQLKPANVIGTQTVLRLASTRRLKPVYFMSSLSIFDAYTASAVTETTPLSHLDSETMMGYAQSKWVAEHLLQTARERGIPTVCIRTGFILGNRQTRQMNPKDQFSLLLQSILQSGKMPQTLSIAHFISPPVDVVCQTLAALSVKRRDSDALSQLKHTCHLVYPSQVWASITAALQQSGSSIEQVSAQDWLTQLASFQAASPGQSRAVAVLKSLYQGAAQARLTALGPQFDTKRTRLHLAQHGIVLPRPDANLFFPYIKALCIKALDIKALTGGDR